MGRDVDGVAQGLEQPAQQLRAVAAGYGRQRGLEWDRRLGQLGAVFAAAAQGRPEYVGDGDAEERRGDVRAVIDVLLQREPAPLLPASLAHQPDRIDVEEQGDRAALGGRLGVEDMRLPERRLERLQARGVLVQQVAEIGRRLMCGGDGELHGDPHMSIMSMERRGEEYSDNGIMRRLDSLLTATCHWPYDNHGTTRLCRHAIAGALCATELLSR